MEGLVEGKKDRGRQRRVWGDDLKEWSKSTSIGQVKRQAENRDVWRKMVHDLCLSATHRAATDKAIKMITDISCITFQKVTASTAPAHYIKFTSEQQGCFSYVGYVSKAAQEVNIGNGCQYDYIVAHEILHALGFFHEQSRSDRDDNIWVITNNVNPQQTHNFDKQQTRNFGTNYDYMSVMQYDSTGFSKDAYLFNTMVPKTIKFQYLMGTGQVLSFWDKSIINQLYQCKKSSCSATCNSPGYVDKNCQCQCPDGVSASGSCDSLKTSLEVNVCGGKYTSAGEIKSPNYPSRPSAFKDGTCAYEIKAPAGKKVQANFVDFNINAKSEGKCQTEHVEVRTSDVKVGSL
ncbi:Blastula protease 10 [Nymphon striatum]|nr:Blastula protease 10 [Nymphon striatum]